MPFHACETEFQMFLLTQSYPRTSILDFLLTSTKCFLSSIKTLKLAILYINYLVDVLDGDQEPKGGFQAELKLPNRKAYNNESKQINENVYLSAKGRTGWPQDVWASELVPEHS
ncbi:heart- and neural crest derivatives-expressed protein 1 [Drosophila grimshawi]|uniref:heart- and neural crest derivatives-expressed protein 1 n=1 Tax=Drosophila grimshawi TaxID=7222 RepID=UPI001C935C38|nr:heart- and neural crest derivatives-expressed protein 1 [Drosophila grimshawi]